MSDNLDNTKKLNLQLSSIAAGTTRTLTVPDKNGTIAVTTDIIGIGQIQPISASVNASALTISASALSLDFRSATLTSGTVTTVTGTPTNLVVPSTATLGTVNATQSRLIVLALNNAGTIELAVVNISGGVELTETGIISTTAISAAASSSNVVYSTASRTNVAYRVIGYIESTQATAGTWVTAPSTIQGQGGQALTAMSGLGYGQTEQLVTRTSGTTYYNTTGRPIFGRISGVATAGGAAIVTLAINGGTAYNIAATFSANSNYAGFYLIGPGESYVLTDTAISTRNTVERR